MNHLMYAVVVDHGMKPSTMLERGAEVPEPARAQFFNDRKYADKAISLMLQKYPNCNVHLMVTTLVGQTKTTDPVFSKVNEKGEVVPL